MATLAEKIKESNQPQSFTDIVGNLWRGFHNNPDNTATYETMQGLLPPVAAYEGTKQIRRVPALLDTGKTGRSKTMNSRHLQKCAADLHFFKDGKLCYPEEIGRFWESLDPLNSAGMFWSKFKDAPHFQRDV